MQVLISNVLMYAAKILLKYMRKKDISVLHVSVTSAVRFNVKV